MKISIDILEKLEKIALEDGIITDEEANLMNQAMRDIEDFEKAFSEAISDGKITIQEKNMLLAKLEEIKDKAYNEALQDKTVSDDEVNILQRLFGVTDELRFYFNSPRAPAAVGLYPHARRVGNLLFLSGVGPRKKDSITIPGVTLDEKGYIISYDIAEQCHAVFENIRFILEDAGSSWENIVDVTVFLTNMKEDFHTYNQIYAEYFKGVQPCRTTVEINALPTPIAIELKVIATV